MPRIGPARSSPLRRRLAAGTVVLLATTACVGPTPGDQRIVLEEPPDTSVEQDRTDGSGDGSGEPANPGVVATDATSPPRGPSDGRERIVVRTGSPLGPFDRRLLGTNVPAWLGPELLADAEFRSLTRALGTSVLRLPGGSWSNHYDWLACELGDPHGCHWTWAARPTDFLEFLDAVDAEGMWTVSINGTAEEAAAVVAFFNGHVDDERPIGLDRRGRDWGTVGSWARLRAQHGNPDPRPIRLWEVGNEVYGAVPRAGPSCSPFGWEEVWTCDGRQYVEGTINHDGYLSFRDAMLAVDPDIQVGAVGVAEQSSWGNWGRDVIAAAGDEMDFYVVHHYAFDGDVPVDLALTAPAAAWTEIRRDLRSALAIHGLDDMVVAVTEYNLVSVLDADRGAAMATALNALYLAETIGQLMTSGVRIANQWNLANGRAENGSDYGLVDVVSRERSPAYFALALWSRFGDEVVAVDHDDTAPHGLRVYAGRRADGSVQLLAVNPTATTISTVISLEPAGGPMSVTADMVTAESLSSTVVSYNGSENPAPDLTHPPAHPVGTVTGDLPYDFPPFSITLLHWEPVP